MTMMRPPLPFRKFVDPVNFFLPSLTSHRKKSGTSNNLFLRIHNKSIAELFSFFFSFHWRMFNLPPSKDMGDSPPFVVVREILPCFCSSFSPLLPLLYLTLSLVVLLLTIFPSSEFERTGGLQANPSLPLLLPKMAVSFFFLSTFPMRHARHVHFPSFSFPSFFFGIGEGACCLFASLSLYLFLLSLSRAFLLPQ